jgi:hypothetical protein
MPISIQPVSTSPKTLSHMQVVIDRLKKNIDALNTGVVAGGGGPLDMTATAAVAIGEVVYADGSGTCDLARADVITTARAIGLVSTAAGIGGTAEVATSGFVEKAGWGLTTDAKYFLDPATAGAITLTPPTTVGHILVPVGIAVSSSQLKLLLSPIVVL